MKHIITAIVLISLITPVFSQKTLNWEILPSSTIKIEGKGMEGEFKNLTGSILFDPENLDQSSFMIELPTANYASGNKTKDKHAHGEDWLDAALFPSIQFESTGIKQDETGEFILLGTLNLHGITKEVTIPFKFTTSDTDKGTFEGTLSITREQFNITGPWMSFMVGDDINALITTFVKRTSE